MKSMFKKSEKNASSTSYNSGPQLAAEQLEPGAEPALPNDEANLNVDDSPPDGGYGWVVVFAVALLNAFTWGIAAVRDIASFSPRPR